MVAGVAGLVLSGHRRAGGRQEGAHAAARVGRADDDGRGILPLLQHQRALALQNTHALPFTARDPCAPQPRWAERSVTWQASCRCCGISALGHLLHAHTRTARGKIWSVLHRLWKVLHARAHCFERLRDCGTPPTQQGRPSPDRRCAAAAASVRPGTARIHLLSSHCCRQVAHAGSVLCPNLSAAPLQSCRHRLCCLVQAPRRVCCWRQHTPWWSARAYLGFSSAPQPSNGELRYALGLLYPQTQRACDASTQPACREAASACAAPGALQAASAASPPAHGGSERCTAQLVAEPSRRGAALCLYAGPQRLARLRQQGSTPTSRAWRIWALPGPAHSRPRQGWVQHRTLVQGPRGSPGSVRRTHLPQPAHGALAAGWCTSQLPSPHAGQHRTCTQGPRGSPTPAAAPVPPPARLAKKRSTSASITPAYNSAKCGFLQLPCVRASVCLSVCVSVCLLFGVSVLAWACLSETGRT